MQFHPNLTSLRASIITAGYAMDNAFIVKSCQSIGRHFETVIACEGIHIISKNKLLIEFFEEYNCYPACYCVDRALFRL
uniref:Uncharacterized protein n=1 Tax=Lepeophtheirus salmonis TaxID=72036 RepID=A0A0K2TMS3_LEPSM